MRIYDITINDLFEPILDSVPRISWKTEAENIDDIQKSYQVIVTKTDDNEIVWKSDVVFSKNSRYIPIKADLKPLTEYTCKILIQNQSDTLFKSVPFTFLTGKLKSTWSGKWIRAYYAKEKGEVNHCASYLRKEFIIDKKVSKALLVICGLGQFEASINNKKVGTDFLSTPYTDFSKQVQYRIYDVKKYLENDENAIGVILGNGFYNSTTNDPWQCSSAIWKDCPKLIAELHITYFDGTSQVLNSDDTWQSSKGPIIFNGMRHGEIYDARLEMDGWNMPRFQSDLWKNVKYVRAPGGILHVMEMEPIHVRHVYKPISKWKSNDGWLFDIGQSQSGIAHFALKGPKDKKITIRYSDILHEDNSLNQEALSSFNQDAPFHTDIYIKRSDDVEYYHPIFVYHGFRYLHIECDYEPDIDDIEVWSLCNDIKEKSQFECSSDTINAIQNLCIKSSESMCFSLMASDTAREQTSWTGDTALSVEQMATNFHCEAFFRNWQQVLRDAQLKSGIIPCIIPSAGWGYNGMNGPDWSHAIYEVPLQFYRYSGDVEMIKDNYTALSKYCDYLDVMANEGIVNYGLGDWCPPFLGKAISVNMESFKCPIEVSDTAYYHSTLKAAQTSAEILNMHNEAEDFKKRAEYVKLQFRKNFFDKSNYSVKGNCQTATAMMIFHNLANEDEVPFLTAKLVQQIKDNDYALDYGILGNKAVINALGENGYADLVITMLTRDSFPSMKKWLDMGATTLWECWNGGGSRNHHMFSCVSEFFYKYIAGIQPHVSAKGYDNILFNPPFDIQINNARATVNTPNGKACIDWKKNNFEYQLQLTVPDNTNAILNLPCIFKGQDIKSEIVRNNLKPELKYGTRYSVNLSAGKYSINILITD